MTVEKNEITICEPNSLSGVEENIRIYVSIGRTSLFAIAKQLEFADSIIATGNTDYTSVSDYGNKVFGYSRSNVSKLVSISKLFIKKENDRTYFIKYELPTTSHAMELLPLRDVTTDCEMDIVVDKIFPSGFKNLSVAQVREEVKNYIESLTIDESEVDESEVDESEVNESEVNESEVNESESDKYIISEDKVDFIRTTLESIKVEVDSDFNEMVNVSLKILNELKHE